jgi:predicted CXXCH cytochrome family protein
MKAVTSSYQHKVAKDECTLCHVVPDSKNEKKVSMRLPTLQKKGILYLGNLLKDKKYQVEVEAFDNTGEKSTAKLIRIIPNEIRQQRGDESPLKQISDVKIEKIRRSIFVEATVSWVTDAPSTTEIEYWIRGEKYRRTFTLENLFTREHRTVLKGLTHKKHYNFRVISRDIFGNIRRSGEYNFDTSYDYSHVNELEREARSLPIIIDIRPIKIGNKKDLYLNVSANKPVGFTVWLKEIKEEEEERPCYDFLPTRYTTIDVCGKCHPQDASHPVGIRSQNPKIKVPEDLPTLEKGIITCITCHLPHGGENMYYVRKIFPKNLCIKCHVGYKKG